MIVTAAPYTAHYKSGIMFFNLSSKSFKIDDSSVFNDYDIAFVYDDDIFYASLGDTLKFGVLNRKTNELYGPYNDPIQFILTTCFGKYDNAMYFFKNCFLFDEENDEYIFKIKWFKYGKFTYTFTDSIVAIAKEIAKTMYMIDIKFDIETTPTTYFEEGAIENFINTLSIMFNRSNFPEFYEESDGYLISRTQKKSGLGIHTKNKNSFFYLNFSNKRHSNVIIPKKYPSGYISFSSDGSDRGNELLSIFEDTKNIYTETNLSTVEYYANKYGFESTVKSIDIIETSIFEDIVVVYTGGNDVRYNYVVFKLPDGSVRMAKADMFKMEFQFIDESEQSSFLIADRYVVDIDENNNVLIKEILYEGEIPNGKDFAFASSYIQFSLDRKSGMCKNLYGDNMSFSFITDYLQYVL